jgi:DNA polymerase-1
MLVDIQNTNCTACALGNTTAGITCTMNLEPKHEGMGGLMIVGDYDDTATTEPLSTKRFKLFWKVAIEACHVDIKHCYPTYAVKCWTNDKKPTAEYATICAKKYLLKEIAIVKPKAILLLGGMPASLFGFGRSIIEERGSIREVTIGSVKTTLVVAHSPAYVEYHSSELKTFALDIYKAWQLAMGKDLEDELPTRVKRCTTIEEVRQVIEYIKQTRECTFDFETTKLGDMGVFDPEFKATLLALSFQHGSAYTIPLEHFESPFTREQVIEILSLISTEVWANPDIHKINQNIKFDMQVAAKYGFPKFTGRVSCTMIMHSLYDDLTKHGIKEWLPTFFPKFSGWEIEVKGKAWDKLPLDKLSTYAGIDADGAFRGFTVLEQKLLEDDRVYDLFRNLYSFALKTLFRMELRGMPMDRDKLIKYESRADELISAQIDKLNSYTQVVRFNAFMATKHTDAAIEELNQKLRTCKNAALKAKYNIKLTAIKSGQIKVYTGINFGSPDQLGELLYTLKGFGFKQPYDKKTRGPKKVTGEMPLKSLNDKTGFVEDLLILRSLQGTKSKYLTGLRELLDVNDYIHTTYNQARVPTGRLSSDSPNLQNIITHVKIKHPAVEEMTPMPKQCFIAPFGYALINWDFSQAELRMMAELSEDEVMIDAYNNNKDLHSVTAANIIKKSFEDFMNLPKSERDPLRQKGKSANFGLIFLQSPEGFQDYAFKAYGVRLSLEEAYFIHGSFFKTYPKVSDYHATYIAKAHRFGYVRTLFGRRAHYPDVHSPNEFLRGTAEKQIVNMPIQGSNGENTVFALTLLEHRLPRAVLLANTVHDSIMAMCPIPLVPYVIKVGVHTCENTPMLRYFGKELKHVKMKCDVQVSLTSWKDLKDYSKETWAEMLQKIK